MSVEVFRKHLKWQAFPVPSRQVHGHESEGSEVRCWSFVHGSHSHLEYLFLGPVLLQTPLSTASTLSTHLSTHLSTRTK